MNCKFKFCVTFLLLFLKTVIGLSQQSAQYTLFHLDKHIFNPAYAGKEQELTATAIARNQWNGIQGAPAYQIFSVNAPLIPGLSGAGLNFENDQIGLEHNTNLSVTYAHHIQLTKAASLSAGIRGVWSRKNLDGSRIITPDGVYEPGSGPDHKDDLLPINSQSANAFSAGVGLLLKINTIEFGIGADGLIPADYTFDALSIRRDPTFFANIGISRDLSEFIRLSVEGLIRTDGTVYQTDIAVKTLINNNIIFGGSFRGYSKTTTDGVSLLAGYRIIENLSLLGAYDFGLSKLRTVHRGSIEIGLKYTIGNKIFREKLPPVIFNPRY